MFPSVEPSNGTGLLSLCRFCQGCIIAMRGYDFREGQLAKVERGTGPRRGQKMSVSLTSFRDFIANLKLNGQIALERQQIGAMPAGAGCSRLQGPRSGLPS
jgi:hypothetical protein